jgi:capsular polysaccharide transport system permease protein
MKELKLMLVTWKALFLREMLSRINSERAGWAWIVLDPAIKICVLILVFTYIRLRIISGISTELFFLLGVLPFTLFSSTLTKSQDAIKANRGLLEYRQVKPVDTVVVRAGIEGFLYSALLLLSLMVFALFSLVDIPEPLHLALYAFLLIWLLGATLAMVMSAALVWIPEIRKMMTPVNRILFYSSAVLFPSMLIPPQYRDFLLLNPMVHCIETLRSSFAPLYTIPEGVNLTYPTLVVLTMLFTGLLMQVAFEKKLRLL